MSNEKRSLADLMKDGEPEELNSQPPAPIAKQEKDEKLPPSRQGKRPYTIWIPEDAHKEIRVLAAEEDISQEQVGKNALNTYFRQLGKAPIA